MKIAISGSSGFIGAHVLKALRGDPKNEIKLLKWRNDCWELLTEDGKGGLIQSESPLDADVVILIGASMPKDKSQVNDLISAGSNVNSALEFTKIPSVGTCKILYFSTIDVYSFDEVVGENTEPRPSSLYGHAKLFSEMLLKEFAQQKGHKLSILRVGHVFGPGESEVAKVVPSMLKGSLNLGEIRLFGEGREQRSFLFVRDLVSMVQEAIRREDIPSLINLVGSQSCSIAELAKLVSNISPRETKIIRMRAAGKPVDQKFDKSLMRRIFRQSQTTLELGLMEELETLQK
jgi:nucleoside-diphosphate-sugar epimerase